MIKLIAVDLDGTVVKHDLSISAKVVEALEHASNQGVKITIATGRGPASTRAYWQNLSVNAPVICTQGGLIYDLATDTQLRRISLSNQITNDVLAFAARHESWQPVLYLDDRIHVMEIRHGEAFYREMLVPEPPIISQSLVRALGTRDSDKILFVVDPHQATAVADSLKQFLGSRASVVQSHAMFVEVNPSMATKGKGLEFVAARLEIDQSEVLAIGDQENDVTMLTWAGVGVAMGNASPSAKEAANWIAPSIEEDGVVAALKKFALK